MGDKPTISNDASAKDKPNENLRLLEAWINDPAWEKATHSSESRLRSLTAQSSSEQSRSAAADDSRRYDGKICVRCHPEKDYQLPSLNYDIFAKGSDLAPFRPLTEAELGAQSEAKYRSQDSLEKVVNVLSRLPADVRLQLGRQETSLQTDFLKLLEAVPTIHLNDHAKQLLSAINKASLDGNGLRLGLHEKVAYPINRVEPLIGKVADLTIGNQELQVSCDVEFAKNGERVTLKYLQGMAFGLESGKQIKVHQLALDASGPIPMISATIDNPKNAPSYLKNVWPDLVPVSFPMNKLFPGVSVETVRTAIKTAMQAEATIGHPEKAEFLKSIRDEEARNKLLLMLGDLQSVTKSGNRFEIKRRGETLVQSLGSAELRVDSKVGFRLQQDVFGSSISSIDGLSVEAPLPAQLRMGSSMTTNVKEVSFGQSNKEGRSLSLCTDGFLDTVSLTVDDNFKPKTDSNGAWRVDAMINNPLSPGAKFAVNLQFDSQGRLASKSSDVLDMIGRATWQARGLSPKGATMVAGSACSSVASELLWLLGR